MIFTVGYEAKNRHPMGQVVGPIGGILTAGVVALVVDQFAEDVGLSSSVSQSEGCGVNCQATDPSRRSLLL